MKNRKTKILNTFDGLKPLRELAFTEKLLHGKDLPSVEIGKGSSRY